MRKFLPKILILLIILSGVGFLGMAEKASAESPKDKVRCGPVMTRAECTEMKQAITDVIDAYGTCTTQGGEDSAAASKKLNMYKSECDQIPGATFDETPQDTDDVVSTGAGPAQRTPFEQEIYENACGFKVGSLGTEGTLYPGCFIQLFYGLFYVIPAWILWVCAYFFNYLISFTLSSALLKKEFVSEAWGVVRDLSNIFFILILLYVAIKMILNMAGHGVKEMITKVILIALLINFSMFFTGIVIDASNMLALVFYNKLEVCVNKKSDESCRPYKAPGGEGKDVAGGLVNAFNPTKLISAEYFAKVKTTTVENSSGKEVPASSPEAKVAPGILIGMLILAGSIMFFAAYCLFVSGFAFLGRLIELFVLIIFSPFAFMSFTVPKLASFEYLGWNNWFKNLVTVSFMAPIFMFFLYFIFMLIKSPIFEGLTPGTSSTLIEAILATLLPAMLILILLKKATEYAKKGSGKFGETLSRVGGQLGGAVTGLALGAATGGVSLALQGTVGASARNVANNEELKRKAVAGDKGAQRKLALANSFAKNSFDFRQTGLGKFVGKQSGLNFDQGLGAIGLDTKSLKDGSKGRLERKGEEMEKKVKTYLLSKDAALKAGDSAKDIDKERRAAYANSLDNQAKDGDSVNKVTRKAINRMWDNYKVGMGKMVTTKTGAAVTLTAGAVSGGIGLAIAPAIGGFLYALRQTVKGTSTNAELVAIVKKGEDPLKHALHELAKHTGGHEEGHPPAAAHPPATHPPTTSGGSAPAAGEHHGH